VFRWLNIIFVSVLPNASKDFDVMPLGENSTSSLTETTAMTDGLGKSEKASGKVFRRYFPLIFILWIILVLYPNPLNLVISIHRVLNFDANPGAVEFILNDLPSAPADIEKAVLAEIPYRHDWEVYSMPWYCPTVEQVLERGEGDCKARALVLASVLEARNITYQIHSSPMHIWVDYENKQETSIENAQVEFYQYSPETGDRQFKIPDIGLGKLMDYWQQQFWSPMPDGRKALLISGLLALIAARVILRKRKTAQLAEG
jgi:transglutaminase-like putative cysteine protease